MTSRRDSVTNTAGAERDLAHKVHVPGSLFLEAMLQKTAARHAHLCPRQVLGVRLGLAALRALGLVDGVYQPLFLNADKRLLTIVETDGCGADGIAVATDCQIGRRTLRVLDYGKLAATLVDVPSGRAVRVTPGPRSRELSRVYAPGAPSRWHSYLEAYKIIPDEDLVCLTDVRLNHALDEILSKPGVRAVCDQCHEEIINEREVRWDGTVLCRSCAGDSYYSLCETT
jgi:formylmethanofuran dehydrogenase subunit E